MDKKTLKFTTSLTELIQKGDKNSTWRLFDEKDLTTGDDVTFINSDTHEEFAHARLTGVREKKMSDLDAKDFEGHESYISKQEMYSNFRGYYGRDVGPDTVVKIITFELLPTE